MELVYAAKYLADYVECPYFIENPVSVISTEWRKPDYIFHPYEFGGYLPKGDSHPMYPDYVNPLDSYPKRTCLWVGGGFRLPKKKPVPIDHGYSRQYKFLGGKSLNTKNIRAASPRGFAKAVFLAMTST